MAPRGAGFFRRIRTVWFVVATAVTVIFFLWSLIAYRASAAAVAAEESDATVRVTRDGGIRRFAPIASAHDGVGLLFLPGGLVSPTAYAPLARAAAEAGYVAVVVELPRRGAFGGADSPELDDRIASVMLGKASPRRWIVAGHSRGAVVASRVASMRPSSLAGLVLIGTTHPRDVDLSALTVPVTKVVGTRDGLARPAGVAANRHLLPAATRWISVQGGNHSQFGWYGFQPGDRFAEIPASDQRRIMIGAVIDALRAAGDTA